MKRRIGSYCAIIFAMILSVSCGRGHGDANVSGYVLARVGNSVLTSEDILSVMPFGLSKDDSVKFVRGYVRTWIDNKLIGEVAINNIPDSKAIDRMVDDYRTELIMWEYRKIMLDQHAPSFLCEDSLKAYYEKYPGDWVNEKPLLKGIFVKVPESDAHLDDIRKWYKSDKTSDLENLEKYTLSKTVEYYYFRERWTDWTVLKDKIPFSDNFSPDNYWKNHKSFEISQNGQIYLLSVSEYMPAKSAMPYEVATDAIKDRLSNERRLQYDRELKDELFNKGIKSGEVEFNIILD